LYTALKKSHNCQKSLLNFINVVIAHIYTIRSFIQHLHENQLVRVKFFFIFWVPSCRKKRRGAAVLPIQFRVAVCGNHLHFSVVYQASFQRYLRRVAPANCKNGDKWGLKEYI
jgi:hypothetical protein